jgi:hypothetical protein
VRVLYRSTGHQEVRFVRTAASFKEGGAIILLWNGHPRLQPDQARAIERVYAQRAPQLVGKGKPPDQLESDTVAAIDESGLFGPASVRRYPWRQEYTAERYLKLHRTYAPVQSLSDKVRQNVQDEIRALIEQQGGIVEAGYVSRLYVARALIENCRRQGR